MGTPRTEKTATAGKVTKQVQQQRGRHSCHPFTLLPPPPPQRDEGWMSQTRHPNATPLAPPHPHTLPQAAAAAVGTKGGGGEGTIPPSPPYPPPPYPPPQGCTRSRKKKEEGGGGGGGGRKKPPHSHRGVAHREGQGRLHRGQARVG
ncbi:unnamed protein product [Closterium sp. NIES-53]